MQYFSQYSVALDLLNIWISLSFSNLMYFQQGGFLSVLRLYYLVYKMRNCIMYANLEFTVYLINQHCNPKMYSSS